jgi:YebC/PmpR family DNA-binding regulatory protein
MSGHSKWATTKHKKAANDAKRSNLWAKLIKNIEVAARTGGGEPDNNPSLFDAIQKEKKNSVPKSNIERAVKRGSGAEAGAIKYEQLIYEGYAPGGVALMIECLTDNHNRAGSEVKAVLTRNGGSLGSQGSVSYMFKRKGQILVPIKDFETGKVTSEDAVLESVMDFNVSDIENLEETIEIITEPNDLINVRTALQNANIEYESAEISFIPSTTVQIKGEEFEKIEKLIDVLEDLVDVQNVYSNFEFDE